MTECKEMFVEYLKERHGQDAVVWEQGFVIYEFLEPNIVYIRHIYVRPKFRRGNVGTELGDAVVDIARKKGCTVLVGAIEMSATEETKTGAMLGFLDYGMTPWKSDSENVYFRKEI